MSTTGHDPESRRTSPLGERAAQLRERSGLLGRWCVVLERVRDDLRRTEQESSALVHRLLARVVRTFFEFLVLSLIAISDLAMLWRRAGNALVARGRR